MNNGDEPKGQREGLDDVDGLSNLVKGVGCLKDNGQGEAGDECDESRHKQPPPRVNLDSQKPTHDNLACVS